MNTIRVSNSLDTDQDRHFVSPDLGSSCLQRLSADDINLLLAKKEFTYVFGVQKNRHISTVLL